MDIVGRYVDTFCNAAIEKGDGTSDKDHELYDLMKSMYQKLESHPLGAEAFSKLLKHENSIVSSWVASQLLALNNDKSALRVFLKRISKEDSFESFSAEIVIEEHKSGNLKPPF
jgi:hypothetical protein